MISHEGHHAKTIMRAGSCETIVLAFPLPPHREMLCWATSCQGARASPLPSVAPLTRGLRHNKRVLTQGGGGRMAVVPVSIPNRDYKKTQH